jgi:hypothetical protein
MQTAIESYADFAKELRTRFLNLELFPTPALAAALDNQPQERVDLVFQSKYTADSPSFHSDSK